MSNSLQPHGMQYARPPCPSPTPRVYPNSCPLSWWCHPTISSSVIPFSSRLQSFPTSGCFPMSQFFASGGHRIGVSSSASVLPVNIQDWFPLGLFGSPSSDPRVLGSGSQLQPHYLLLQGPHDPRCYVPTIPVLSSHCPSWASALLWTKNPGLLSRTTRGSNRLGPGASDSGV